MSDALLRCIWCGTPGDLGNHLLIQIDNYANPLAECEWCSTTEYFRRMASNGQGN
jgi:hypothetical protein